MLRVLESISRYHPRGAPLSAWVFRIARNRLSDVMRRPVRRREVGLMDNVIAPAGPPHAAVERALDYRAICGALSQLTETQEQVIVLRFMKDLDIATVARILGRSQSAVKSLQFRALASLRRILDSKGQTELIASAATGSARPFGAAGTHTAPQGRPNAGAQFIGAERLDDVVVGNQFQPPYLIAVRILGGDEDDWRARLFA